MFGQRALLHRSQGLSSAARSSNFLSLGGSLEAVIAELRNNQPMGDSKSSIIVRGISIADACDFLLHRTFSVSVCISSAAPSGRHVRHASEGGAPERVAISRVALRDGARAPAGRRGIGREANASSASGTNSPQSHLAYIARAALLPHMFAADTVAANTAVLKISSSDYERITTVSSTKISILELLHVVESSCSKQAMQSDAATKREGPRGEGGAAHAIEQYRIWPQQTLQKLAQALEWVQYPPPPVRAGHDVSSLTTNLLMHKCCTATVPYYLVREFPHRIQRVGQLFHTRSHRCKDTPAFHVFSSDCSISPYSALS